MMRYLTPFRWGHRSVPASREPEGNPLNVFQREMNRLFDDFFKGTGIKPWAEEMETLGAFTPQVNMTEDEKFIQVSAELPGLDEKDLEISLSKDSLTIKGEKKEENEHKDKEAYYLERSFGTFTRVLPIPRDVNTEKAEASFKKGVLTITLPKLEREKQSQKKIRIKAD
jgi:HSP20 family protein